MDMLCYLTGMQSHVDHVIRDLVRLAEGDGFVDGTVVLGEVLVPVSPPIDGAHVTSIGMKPISASSSRLGDTRI